MSEALNPSKKYRQPLFDYFFPADKNGIGAYEKQEFITRGLAPTNNLHLYFIANTSLELAPGIPNPYHYRNRPFGPAIDDLRIDRPDLWEKALAAPHSSRMTEFFNLVNSGQETEAEKLSVIIEADFWNRNKIFTEIYDCLAPQVDAMGIDPLSMCV